MSKLALSKETLRVLDDIRTSGGTGSIVEVVSEYPITDNCVPTEYATPTGFHWTMNANLCHGPFCAL